MTQNVYKNLIFTNHVLHRMNERGITQDQVWETFTAPDLQDKVKEADRREKKFGDHSVTIVFKYNELHEPVLLSAWIDPPKAGTKDAQQKDWWNKYKKAGALGKIWLTIIKQINGY